VVTTSVSRVSFSASDRQVVVVVVVVVNNSGVGAHVSYNGDEETQAE
jgi:hypothetical protein